MKLFTQVSTIDSNNKNFIGSFVPISEIVGQPIQVYFYNEIKSKFNKRKKIGIQLIYNNKYCVLATTSKRLIEQLESVQEFPFATAITAYRTGNKEMYSFT